MLSKSKTKENFNPSYDEVPNVRFSLRLTEKLYNELLEYSYQYKMSMNALILNCIKYAMKNREDNS